MRNQWLWRLAPYIVVAATAYVTPKVSTATQVAIFGGFLIVAIIATVGAWRATRDR